MLPIMLTLASIGAEPTPSYVVNNRTGQVYTVTNKVSKHTTLPQAQIVYPQQFAQPTTYRIINGQVVPVGVPFTFSPEGYGAEPAKACVGNSCGTYQKSTGVVRRR